VEWSAHRENAVIDFMQTQVKCKALIGVIALNKGFFRYTVYDKSVDTPKFV